MAIYTTPIIPEEYNQAILQEEFEKIALALANLEIPWIVLEIQNIVPEKLFEGMVAHADGSNWNPGSGAGLYQYQGGSWTKL